MSTRYDYDYANGLRRPTRTLPAAVTGVELPHRWRWALMGHYDTGPDEVVMEIAPVCVDARGAITVMGPSRSVPYDGRGWSDPYAAEAAR